MDRVPTTPPQKSTPTAGELDGAVLESLQFKLIWKHMWKVFWGNWIAILGLSILTGIVAAIPQGPIQILTIQAKKDPMSAGLVIFILSVISTLLRVQIENGWIRYRLVLVRGQAVLLRVFYEDIMRVFSTLVAGVVFGIVVAVGYILFIVPGVIWSIKYRYTIMLIVDRKIGIGEAFSMSDTMTRNIKWRILVLDARAALVALGPLLAELLVVLGAVFTYQNNVSWWPWIVGLSVIGAISYFGYLIAVTGPLSFLHFYVYELLLNRLSDTSQPDGTKIDVSGKGPTLQAPPDVA